MGLITLTPFQYYEASELFLGDGVETDFTLTLDPLPTSEEDFNVYIDDVLVAPSSYSYSSPTVSFNSAPANSS